MNDSTGTVATVMPTVVINGYAQYNEAIDDACHALEVTGNVDGWRIVRALREPKINW